MKTPVHNLTERNLITPDMYRQYALVTILSRLSLALLLAILFFCVSAYT